MDGIRVQPLDIEFLDGGERLRRIAVVKHLIEPALANGFEDQTMLLAQNLFLLLISEIWALGLVGVRGGTFADAAAADEDLSLQQQVRLAGLALHVVNRVLVLDVRIEAKDHAFGGYQCQ